MASFLNPPPKRTKKTEMAQFGGNFKYAQDLQDVLSLLAYPDPLQSPVAHFLDQSRRDLVSAQLNAYILCKLKFCFS